jgi:hypothetical protein
MIPYGVDYLSLNEVTIMSGVIYRKLNSKRGASLAMALLLFLVCMAVSSVVLTAATVAAGRLSELVKMDQRYFSVTSAAELLRSDIETELVVVCTKTVEEVTEENPEDPGGEPVVTEVEHRSYELQGAGADKNYLQLQTLKLVQGETLDTMNLTIESTNSDYDKLKAKVTIAPLPDPQRGMLVTISNDNGDSQIYLLKMTCVADVLEEVVGNVTTYTVTWTVSGITR